MRCTVSCNEIHRYPYNYLYKAVPVTATICSKFKSLTLILPLKIKKISILVLNLTI